jgi:hypothetical protein
MRTMRDWIIAFVVALALSALAQLVHWGLTGGPLRVLMVLGWTPFWMVIHVTSVRRGDYRRCAEWLRRVVRRGRRTTGGLRGA